MVFQGLASVNDRLQPLTRKYPAVAQRKPRKVRWTDAQAKGLRPVANAVFTMAIRAIKAKSVFA